MSATNREQRELVVFAAEIISLLADQEVKRSSRLVSANGPRGERRIDSLTQLQHPVLLWHPYLPCDPSLPPWHPSSDTCSSNPNAAITSPNGPCFMCAEGIQNERY